MDRDYRIMAKSQGISINRTAGDNIVDIPVELARIRSIWIFITVALSSTIGFGWAVDRQAHLSVPLIMTFLCGIANNGVFNVSPPF
jgi:hypothetical protein